MAVFRFRLEKVLHYRRRLVDLRSRDVAAAELALAAIRRRCEELREQLAAVEDPTRIGAVVDVGARRALAAWYDRQEKELERLAAEQGDAAAEVARRREDLARAWRDREVMERLRQRRRDAWLKDQERRDRAELDEIGQQRALRARMGFAERSAQVAT